MQHESLSESQLKLLRPVDPNTLKVGDSVYSRSGTLFQVAATPGPDGDVATRNHVGNVCMHRACWLKLAPLFWLEGMPVYLDDKVYQKGVPGELTVKGFHGDLVDTLYISSIHINTLTRTDPTILFEVEGRPVRSGDTVWTLSGDEVTVKRMEHGKVITSPSDWCFCTMFDKEWLSLTPIQRIVVDGETVDQSDLLYFRESGEVFKVFRQVRDVLEDCKGRKAYAHQLTYSDPKQELVEVPIWVNFHDDGTSTVMFNSPGITRCVKYQAKGTIKVPKHIADKLKR